VARFIGRANVFDARVIARDSSGIAAREPGGITFVLPAPDAPERVAVVLRPEAVQLVPGTADARTAEPNSATGVVDVVQFAGATAQLAVRLADGTRLQVEGAGDLPQHFPPGTAVVASWHASALVACEA
jgi:ABC-type Fe3+/spermidine/putrescine transport system ATPase subunit